MRIAIVHYHLSGGGVSQVIGTTSRSLTTAGIRHVILTGDSAANDLHTRTIEGLGYLKSNGGLSAERLLESMRKAATEALGGVPDVWHFHNHSLGKNFLIADVVAQLAESGEALVLHLHDLAENGRPANYQIIPKTERLYPFSPRIRYAFLNPRDRDVFIAAGLPAESALILPNPVAFETIAPSDPAARGNIILAPVRGIRRKNIGELVMLSALAPAGNHFAITRAPLDPEALHIHDTWRKFAAKHRLPIAFDVVDHFAPRPGASADFDSWMRHATHFVSTSVEEGFGLPFIEAHALGKPLFGRNLKHLADSPASHGTLYDRLLVPVDWIDLTILEDHLTTTLERNHRLYRQPLSKWQIARTLDFLVTDGLLDFGNLPEPLQQGVIERLDDPDSRRVPLVETAGVKLALVDWLVETIGQRTPAVDPERLNKHSPASCARELIRIYREITTQPVAHIRFVPPAGILKPHLIPERFHFLLSALEPPAAKVNFRAVVFDIYGTLLIAPSGGVKPDPLTDPVLRDILRNFGHEPPLSPSGELHAAVRRHHDAAGVPFPEVDLRVLWREILSLDAGSEIGELVEALEAAWHPAKLMPGAEKIVGMLARKFISLGLLSNAQCNTLASLGGLADLFAPELTVLSYQHGIAKPAPELFQILRERLEGRKITPAETLYVGNDPLHDIVPAAAAGFRTALFTGHPDSLRPGDCKPDFILKTWADLSALF